MMCRSTHRIIFIVSCEKGLIHRNQAASENDIHTKSGLKIILINNI